MRPNQSAPVPVPTTIRWWRLRPWSRNHLMRSSDRVEATLVLLASMLVQLMVPVAAAFGTSTHTRLQHQTEALRADVDQVPAVLLEDSYPAPDTTGYSCAPPAPGKRPAPGGRHPTGTAPPQCPPIARRRPVRRSPSASTPTATSPAPSPAPGTTPWWR